MQIGECFAMCLKILFICYLHLLKPKSISMLAHSLDCAKHEINKRIKQQSIIALIKILGES